MDTPNLLEMSDEEFKEWLRPSNIFLNVDEVKSFCMLTENKEDLYPFIEACRAENRQDYVDVILEYVKDLKDIE